MANQYNKGDIFDRERAKLSKAAKRDAEKEVAAKASPKGSSEKMARPSDLGSGMAAKAARAIMSNKKKLEDI
jgi:hypothetical protein